MLTRHRGLKQSDSGHCGRTSANLVNSLMITVPVAAWSIVTEQDIHRLFTQHIRKPGRSLVGISSHEANPARRIWIKYRPVAAVGIAKIDNLCRTNRLRAVFELIQPNGFTGTVFIFL